MSLPATSRTISQALGDPSVDADWNIPSPQEWAVEYKKYKSFRLPGSPVGYKVDQYVYILPNTADTLPKPAKKRKSNGAGASDGLDEANDPEAAPWWIGHIRDVKAKDEKNVFIVVRWLCTTVQQLREYGVNKVPKRIEGHEIFYTDFEDILPVHVVEDHAPIVHFDEMDPLLEPIGPEQVWYRSTVRYVDLPPPTPKPGKTLKKKKRAEPNYITAIVPDRPASCFCESPYKPLPLDTGEMVYCPASDCRKWYHTDCLEARNLVNERTPRTVASLAASGLGLLDVNASPGTLPIRTNAPSVLREAAQSSILRGGTETGIVGNGQKVLHARRAMLVTKKTTLAATLHGLVASGGQAVDNDEAGFAKEWMEKFAPDAGEDAFDLTSTTTNGANGVKSSPTSQKAAGRKSRRSMQSQANDAPSEEILAQTGEDTAEATNPTGRCWKCPSCHGPI